MDIGIHGQNGQLVLLLVEAALTLERENVPILPPSIMAIIALSTGHLKERIKPAIQEPAVSISANIFVAFYNIYKKSVY